MTQTVNAEILGLRELTCEETLIVMDVNQLVGACLNETGRNCVVRVNAVTGSRVIEYALRGRKTAQGQRVIIGSSAIIMETFVYTLSTNPNPDERVPEKEAQMWFLALMNQLNRRGALFFDRTQWDRRELKELAKQDWGMPDWEDQAVYQTMLNLGADAIVGHDAGFKGRVERNGRMWIDPQMVKTLMAA